MADGRSNEYLITMTVNGVNTGTWDKIKGGAVDSDESKYRGGGMGPQQTLGGLPAVGNVTVTRLYDRDRDIDIYDWLYGLAGFGGNATVSRQPLDADGVPRGRPKVYTGLIKAVTPMDTDSNGNTPDTYDVEISTEGNVG